MGETSQNRQEPPVMLFADEAARIVRCTPRAVVRNCQEAKWTGRKINGRWQIPQSDIELLLRFGDDAMMALVKRNQEALAQSGIGAGIAQTGE